MTGSRPAGGWWLSELRDGSTGTHSAYLSAGLKFSTITGGTKTNVKDHNKRKAQCKKNSRRHCKAGSDLALLLNCSGQNRFCFAFLIFFNQTVKSSCRCRAVNHSPLLVGFPSTSGDTVSQSPPAIEPGVCHTTEVRWAASSPRTPDAFWPQL